MLKDAVPLDQCRRALVVNLGHYGDVLLASPVLSVLKAHAPHLEIDALVYDETAPMLEGHSALAMLHTVHRGRRGSSSRLAAEWRLFRALRGRRYDLLVHLSRHIRGAWLARLLGARYSAGMARPQHGRFWRKSFTHLYPVVSGNRRHQVETKLDALRRIGVQPALDERGVQFAAGAAAEQAAAALAPPRPFIVIHPASRWRFKCWPVARNAELIDRLSAEGHDLVVTGAPDDTDMVDAILSRTRAPVLNLAGKLSIKELGALIARARLFVGVDSMPMHLASAVGVPTVALFGPSSEAEWGPWAVPRRIVTSSHSCRPCGYDGCGGGKVSECITVLPVELVHAAARELLAESRVREPA